MVLDATVWQVEDTRAAYPLANMYVWLMFPATVKPFMRSIAWTSLAVQSEVTCVRAHAHAHAHAHARTHTHRCGTQVRDESDLNIGRMQDSGLAPC